MDTNFHVDPNLVSVYLVENAFDGRPRSCYVVFTSDDWTPPMIKNGLYSFTATSREEVDSEVRGTLILRDGQILGGDSYVYYTGSYECTAGQWRGEITSREHTPTTRPTTERVQQIGFLGTYNDAGAKIDAVALVGEQSVRYSATLRFLAAGK